MTVSIPAKKTTSIRAVVRSAHIAIAEAVREEFRRQLGVKNCFPIFQPKMSVVLDPDSHRRDPSGDSKDFIKRTTIDLAIAVSAKEIPARYRRRFIPRQFPYTEPMAIIAAVLIRSEDNHAERTRAAQLLDEFGIPCQIITLGDTGPVFELLRWSDMAARHVGYQMRQLNNSWHLDLIKASAAIAPNFNMRVVVEVGLASVVDLDAYCANVPLQPKRQQYLRDTTLDIVLCSEGPVALPLAVVHVDGDSHNSPLRQEQDGEVNELLGAVGIFTCRARLDGGMGKFDRQRSNGPGDRGYWERVVAAMHATCIQASAVVDRHIENGAVKDVIGELVKEVCQQNPWLGADLQWLTGMLIVELEERLRVTKAQVVGHDSFAYQYDEDPRESEFYAQLWQDEGEEESLKRFGPRALLHMRRKTNVDADKELFEASLETRMGCPVPDVPSVTRYVPTGAVRWFGEGEGAARESYTDLVWWLMSIELFRMAAPGIAKHGQLIREHWTIARTRQEFGVALAEWNRLTLNDREAEIISRLCPRVGWIAGGQAGEDGGSSANLKSEQLSGTIDFLRNVCDGRRSLLDKDAKSLNAQDLSTALTRLEVERAKLLELIRESASPQDEGALLADLLEEWTRSYTEQLKGQVRDT